MPTGRFRGLFVHDPCDPSPLLIDWPTTQPARTWLREGHCQSKHRSFALVVHHSTSSTTNMLVKQNKAAQPRVLNARMEAEEPPHFPSVCHPSSVCLCWAMSAIVRATIVHSVRFPSSQLQDLVNLSKYGYMAARYHGMTFEDGETPTISAKTPPGLCVHMWGAVHQRTCDHRACCPFHEATKTSLYLFDFWGELVAHNSALRWCWVLVWRPKNPHIFRMLATHPPCACARQCPPSCARPSCILSVSRARSYEA